MKQKKVSLFFLLILIVLLLFSFIYVTYGSNEVPDEKQTRRVIVGFKEGTTYLPIGPKIITKSEGILDATNIIIKKSLRSINAEVIEADSQMIEELEKDPNVEFIEEDYEVKVLGEISTWNYIKINSEVAYSNNIRGSGIKIGIVDTGIDYNHPELISNYAGGYDFVNEDSDPLDDNGHGTHVAGIIAANDNEEGIRGIAPDSEIYAIKVLDDSGLGYVSDIIGGIEWAINNDINIVLMSLGTPQRSIALEQEINNAYNNNILLVAAAGNDGPSTISNVYYPAAYDNVIAVVATDEDNKIADFSSTGPEIELGAPGVNIYSTYLDNSYATLSGTSMAAPHVAGTAALLWSKKPNAQNIEIRDILHSSVIDLGPLGRDEEYGYGLVQWYAMTNRNDTNQSQREDNNGNLTNVSINLTFSFESQLRIDTSDFQDFSLLDTKTEKEKWLLNTELLVSDGSKDYSINVLEFYNETYYWTYLLFELRESDFEDIISYGGYDIYYNYDNIYWVSKSMIVIINGPDNETIPNSLISVLLKLFPSDLNKGELQSKYTSFRAMVQKRLKADVSAQSCKSNGYTCSMFDIWLVDNSYWTYECCSGYCNDGWWSNECSSNPLGSGCRSGGASCVINGGLPLIDDTFRTPECCSDWCVDDPIRNQCGLVEGEGDCDKGITDLNGYECIPGLICSPGSSGDTNDHCCPQGEMWDSSWNQCIPEVLECSDCGGSWLDNNICDENECINLGECYYCEVFGNCWTNIPTIPLTDCYNAGGFGDSDYCIYKKQKYNGCNHGEYDCDSDSECGSGLVCDGQGSLFVGDGCCYNFENWNNDQHFCNYAIKGTIYNVTTNSDGTSNQNKLINSKVLFNMYDENLQYIGPSFMALTNADQNGDYKFNPEHHINELLGINFWNSNLFLHWTVEAFVLDSSNEILGTWSNDFSSEDEDYRLGKKYNNQIVRVHTDKQYWKKTTPRVTFFSLQNKNQDSYVPKINYTESMGFINSSFSTLSQPIQLISVFWNGSIRIDDKDVYTFKFSDLAGGLRVILNENTMLSDWRDNVNLSDRTFNVYLERGEYPLRIEYYQYEGQASPILYWKTNNSNFTYIDKEHLIKNNLQFEFYERGSNYLSKNEKNFATQSIFYSNNKDDYQVSFLEPPTQINANKRPLVLVHGFHGTSGYWTDTTKGNSIPERLSGKGLDQIWKFYWPNDQKIVYSSALLRDGLEYILKNYPTFQKADLVSHSTGGLVTLAYIENMGITPLNISINYSDNIRKFIPIAALFYGSHQANYVLDGSWLHLIVLWWNGDSPEEPIFKDLAVGSEFTWKLNSKGLDNRIDYLSIAGTRNMYLLGVINLPMEAIDSDGIVSVSSASLLDKNVPLVTINRHHGEQIGKDSLLMFPENTDTSKISNLIYSFIIQGTSNLKTYLSNGEYYINPSDPNSHVNFFNYGNVIIGINGSGIVNTVSLNNNIFLTKNPYSNNWFFFNWSFLTGGQGLGLTKGVYDIFINGVDSNKDLNINGARTTLQVVLKELCVPSGEICDGKDNDCDGQTDEGGNALCGDGFYCNGQEVCNGASGCQAGTPVSCADSVSCTIDSCNEATDSCTHTANDNLCPADTDCGDYYCNVVSGCAVNYKPSTTICRASSGQCDAAEVCTGSSVTCPIDQVRPNGYSCRSVAGDCDIAETCNGVSKTCSSDQLRPSGYQCRASEGVCDILESCTGISAQCPNDAKSTALCRAAIGECDVADYCNGISNNCPTDLKAPTSTQCGTDYWDYSCYLGNSTDSDTYKKLHDFHCNGAGSCLDYTQNWIVDEYCIAYQYCYYDGSGNSDEDYYCKDYPFDFNIISPVNDSSSDSRYVYLTITSEQPMEKLEYSLDGDRYSSPTLSSRNRNQYSTKKTIRDGNHSLNVRVTYPSSKIITKTVNFFVDSTKPRITRQEPRTRGYCNGTFNVKYTEEYLKNVYLYYGDSIAVDDNCSSGRNQECPFDVPITQYENKTITFHFEVEDLFWKILYRRNHTCLVDTTPPHITYLTSFVNGNYLYLNISLNEEARYLKYIDYNKARPTERSLCSSCQQYGSTSVRRKYFRTGSHSIEIITEDDAGNRAESQLINFQIV